QLARARVLATQSRRPFRTRAVALLEEIQKKGTLGPDNQLLLAQLHQGMGPEGWAKASETLRVLVGRYGRNPLYLNVYAQGLLQHGDYDGAGPIIGQLEQVEKGRQADLGAAELRARLLELRGKGRQALAVLKAYADAPGARPERVLL